jgi:hypothetical protein
MRRHPGLPDGLRRQRMGPQVGLEGGAAISADSRARKAPGAPRGCMIFRCLLATRASRHRHGSKAGRCRALTAAAATACVPSMYPPQGWPFVSLAARCRPRQSPQPTAPRQHPRRRRPAPAAAAAARGAGGLAGRTRGSLGWRPGRPASCARWWLWSRGRRATTPPSAPRRAWRWRSMRRSPAWHMPWRRATRCTPWPCCGRWGLKAPGPEGVLTMI